MIPKPSADPGLFTHAAIVLTVIIATAVLLGMGKIDAVSATPLFGAALGIAPRASQSYPKEGNGNGKGNVQV